MNEKKCKKLRRELRRAGVDVKQKLYVKQARSRTIYLLDGCGHAIYQQLKGRL